MDAGVNRPGGVSPVCCETQGYQSTTLTFRRLACEKLVCSRAYSGTENRLRSSTQASFGVELSKQIREADENDSRRLEPGGVQQWNGLNCKRSALWNSAPQCKLNFRGKPSDDQNPFSDFPGYLWERI